MNPVLSNDYFLTTVKCGATLGIGILIYAVINWSTMPVLQRMDSLFFCALVLHLW